MTPESLGNDLTARDNADAPRCPMEALADNILCRKKPTWLKRNAFRHPFGVLWFEFSGSITTPEQLDDLINFLQEVRG